MLFKINLNHLGDKWLVLKKQRMQNLLKIALPDEALYREIMLSLGYPNNKVNFLQLALMTPFSEIKKLEEKNSIEKALLYRAGFIDDKNDLPENFDFSLRMDKSVWNHKGIRPANFPEKRIKGVSGLLSKTSKSGLVSFFLEKIKSEINNKNLKKALKNIMNFEGVGIQRKEEMFFNIIMPFMTVYSQENEVQKFLSFMFENYPPLSENKFVRDFKYSHPEIKIKNVKAYMGVILFQKKNIEDE
ncbi:MAG TPA: DUF2851 family protein [Syntrophorhabdaceae bacterium]|nr:DUF2851 family protein [Syntrophorhabdaceae bacterium]HOL05323.1 DUF2851 family protein [Syntrophorhabdaceae bacterium]HPP41751.1 DUF2851 family protein [Syntrophorhabdaceae bacterium]